MDHTCIVRIEGVPRDFHCGNECVLDAAIAAGLNVPYNCRGGACGTCKAQVLEGEVEQGWVMGFALSDEELSQGKCLICSSKPKSERLVLRMLNSTAPAQNARAFIPQEYQVLIVAAHNLTPSVRMLTVQMPPDRLFSFDGGMYMDFRLDGVDPPRPYSIATAPTGDGTAPDGMISFLIARHEHGVASGRLHEATRPGDTLQLRGPYGTFRFPASRQGATLLLGGGTGLAPLLSLATQALERGYRDPIELWLSVRTRREVFFVSKLQRLAGRYPHFSYRLFLTHADPTGKLPDRWCSGRITQYLPQSAVLTRAERVLIAGSPEFVRACQECAVSCGAKAHCVLTEAYEPKLPCNAQARALT
jgi:ferredoxin-NADP reductase/ferredoxin